MKTFKKFVEEKKFKVNYGIMVLDSNNNIVHFCAYEKQPTQYDYDGLKQEIATDEEFELTNQIENLTFVEAPSDIVEKYKKIIGKI